MNIDSLEQLEALRILGDDPEREWRDDEIAVQIQSMPETTLRHLSVLEGRGMVRCVRREGRLFCTYGPQSPELEAQVRRLLEIYRQRPVTMIRMVYERPPNVLRAFSDAFRLRREE